MQLIHISSRLRYRHTHTPSGVHFSRYTHGADAALLHTASIALLTGGQFPARAIL